MILLNERSNDDRKNIINHELLNEKTEPIEDSEDEMTFAIPMEPTSVIKQCTDSATTKFNFHSLFSIYLIKKEISLNISF